MNVPLPPHRIDLLGCPLDILSLDQAVLRVDLAMRLKIPMRHVALNTAKLIGMRENPDLYDDVVSSDLITADGMGIVLAARAMGHQIPGRVTGIDLMEALLGLCARKGYRPYILGARHEVLKTALRRIRARHPKLVLAGARNGFFGPEDEVDIVERINASGADCLFVGIPTPIKERFLSRNHGNLSPAFAMGVGGSIDVMAGLVPRAPEWMQRNGMEWLHRTLQEPQRMWRRYLVSNAKFAVILGTGLVCRATGQAYAPLAQSPSAN